MASILTHVNSTSMAFLAEVGLPTLLSLVIATALMVLSLLWVGRNRRKDGATAVSNRVLVKGWVLAALFMTVIFLAGNHLLVRGLAAGKWDADGQYFPYFVLVADHARMGQFVSWDPWTNGGLPAVGDPQVGAFSPLTNLFGVIFGGTSLGFRAYWLFMWWLGGLGMLLLARHFHAPAWGGCIVALGFLFCGVYLGNAEHTTWLVAYSFLPLVVWRLDKALRSSQWLPAAEAGALWGLSALAGSPAVIILTGAFCGLWALGWVALSEYGAEASQKISDGVHKPARIRHAILALFLMALVGLLTLSPTYLAFFYEGAGIHPRVGALERSEAQEDALQPEAISTFASPYLTALNEHHRGRLWPRSDVSMVNVYVGVAIPVLALFALLRRPAEIWRWWVLAMGLFALAAAVGESLPVRGWLYDWAFPTRFFRHPAVFRLDFLFSLCVLALYATRDLHRDSSSASATAAWARLTGAVGAIVLGAFVAVAPYMTPFWEQNVPQALVRLGRLHFTGLWLALMGVVALGWMLRPSHRTIVVPILLIWLAGADTLLTSRLSVSTVLGLGYEIEHWRALDAAHSASLDLRENGLRRDVTACPDLEAYNARQQVRARCRRNDQLITKVPVFEAYATEKNARQLAMVAHPVLRKAATSDVRFWFSAHVARVPPTDDNFEEFIRRTNVLSGMPLLVHTPEELLQQRAPQQLSGVHTPDELPQQRARTSESGPGDMLESSVIRNLPLATPVMAGLVAYSPRELVFDVRVEQDGWLLVTERWARGWRLEVNGVPQPNYGGNFIFRAVPLTAGRNHIVFMYAPLAFPWLAVASWGLLAVIGGMRATIVLRNTAHIVPQWAQEVQPR